MSGAGSNPPGWQVLIGTDADYSALVRAALRVHDESKYSRLLVLFGAAETFPFRPRPSTILVPGMPPGVIASIPPLEEVGIASRLASTAGLPGCHDGTVIELAELWLRSLDPGEIAHARLHVYGAQTAIAAERLADALSVSIANIPTD